MENANQSFRILANVIAAGAHHSSPALDDMICVLMDFSASIIELKLTDALGLAIKVILNLG